MQFGEYVAPGAVQPGLHRPNWSADDFRDLDDVIAVDERRMTFDVEGHDHETPRIGAREPARLDGRAFAGTELVHAEHTVRDGDEDDGQDDQQDSTHQPRELRSTLTSLCIHNAEAGNASSISPLRRRSSAGLLYESSVKAGWSVTLRVTNVIEPSIWDRGERQLFILGCKFVCEVLGDYRPYCRDV